MWGKPSQQLTVTDQNNSWMAIEEFVIASIITVLMQAKDSSFEGNPSIRHLFHACDFAV